MSGSTAFIEFGTTVNDVVSSAGTNADQRRREARAKLYRQLPNSNFLQNPLAKMVLGNTEDSVENPKFEWGMEAHDDLYTSATGTYSDTGLSSAIGNAQTAAGTTVYIKMAEASGRQFIKHELVQIRTLHKTDDAGAGHQAVVHGYLTADPVLNGANSYLTIKTSEIDTAKALYYANDGTNYYAYIMPISTAMPEGSPLPWHRYREATEHYNYCQIMMAGLGLTGTELSNAQRFTEKTYNRYWRQVLDRWNLQFERTLFWSFRDKVSATVDMGNGNQTVDQYRTGGLYWMLTNEDWGNSRNVWNIRNTTTFGDYDFTGKTWEEGGYDYLKQAMITLSKKSGKRKKMFLSAEALLSLTNLFESMTQVQVDSKFKDEWGFRVTKIYGLTCELELHLHQDFSLNPMLTRTAFILEPEKIKWCSKKGRDMTIIKSAKELREQTNVQDGFNWRDATKEGIIMDGGLMLDDLDGMAMITNLGCDFKAS